MQKVRISQTLTNQTLCSSLLPQEQASTLTALKHCLLTQDIKQNVAQYSHKDKVISGIKFYYSKDFHSRLNYQITVYALITGDFR